MFAGLKLLGSARVLVRRPPISVKITLVFFSLPV
jgi:hypothetical protein